jgi:dihydropteroate synthase
MKFKLLEIESVILSASQSPEFSPASNGRIGSVRSLLIRVEELSEPEIQDYVKISAMYPNSLSVINYNNSEITLRIDLNGYSPRNSDFPDSLGAFFRYMKKLQENLRFYLDRWQQLFGISFDRPLIMGIINVTPDSFSDGGVYTEPEEAVRAGLSMVDQGADVIDIGGESSRPGAEPVAADLEMKRVIPVIEGIRKNNDVFISVDTYKAEVASVALNAGANWINDISGLRSDPDMISLCRERDVPVILMHMQGTPQTMQKEPKYESVVDNLVQYFEKRIKMLIEKGIDKIILDPGIGFGKTLEHNIGILRNVQIFKQFGYPLLIGTSRKSFIGTLTGRQVDERLAGTLSSVAWSVLHGVNIVRVHDVTECADTLKIINSICKNVWVIAFVIIFQPELRRLLIYLGQSRLVRAFVRIGEPQYIEDVVAATMEMSNKNFGAIIVMLRDMGVKSLLETGVQLQAQLSKPLINAVFNPRSPLHDGALIIRGEVALAAKVLLPLSQNPEIDPALGTRHRAAIGVSEQTDAIVVVVSEETGMISVVEDGKMVRGLTEEMLRNRLSEAFAPVPKEKKGWKISLFATEQ